jgi:hypothetical protein
MPNFPLTFPYAGRTFGVVADATPDHTGANVDPETGWSRAIVFVRVVGTKGLHEIGPVVSGETDEQLAARICRWYDEMYGGARDIAETGGTNREANL